MSYIKGDMFLFHLMSEMPELSNKKDKTQESTGEGILPSINPAV